MGKPALSFVVIFYNMRREAPRTLLTLSSEYQQGASDGEWEVIAVDNGSSAPLDAEMVEAFGDQFSYHYFATDSSSPVEAINYAVGQCSGEYISVCIDGARMLSPGIVHYTLAAFRAYPEAVVATLAFHLGEKLQNEAIADGYDQEQEDKLLDSVDWRRSGYALFDIACLAASSRPGFGEPISESNCVSVSAGRFDQLGGYDERFQTPGGGLANLDFMRRACEGPASTVVYLLGEGTFHQFHGGVATNVAPSKHPGQGFRSEYRQIRGEAYRKLNPEVVYLGTMTRSSRRFFAT